MSATANSEVPYQPEPSALPAWQKILLLLILALAAFLRFYHLSSYSLWSDEFVTLMIATKDSFWEVIRTCFEVPQPMPPLYFLLTKWSVGWLGPSEASLRLVSAASSLAAVYLVFAVGRFLFSVEAGLFAALLCAINSLQIVYAQNARPYAFCLLLSALSMWFFLKWLESRSRLNAVGFVASTTLLFYSHYIFFPLILIQNVYLFWRLRSGRMPKSLGASGNSVKEWLTIQGVSALLLLPLVPQLWRVLRARHELNWQSALPEYKDFFFFFDGATWGFALAAALTVWGLGWFLVSLWKGRLPQPLSARRGVIAADALVFLSWWYFLPVVLFFLVARGLGINLFVERYLTLSSLPAFLLLSGLPLTFFNRSLARIFLIAYVAHYVNTEPGHYFRQKGEFSQGIPGANEWRETLTALKGPSFQAPLFLFQSPFIESNQLSYAKDPKLFRYLSAPLESFYLADYQRDPVLLPVQWWINNEAHLKFKAQIRQMLLSQPDFLLLATQEFWNSFRGWLQQEFALAYDIQAIQSFNSTGSLCLKRVRLVHRPTGG